MTRRGTESSGTIPGDIAIAVGHCEMPAPPRWEWRRLTDLARLETGHTPSRQQPSYWHGGIPWIGIKDARQYHGKIIEATYQTVTQDGLDNSAARLLPQGTVCLSRTASIGYVTIMGKPMATSQDFVNWVCGPVIDPKFLMHLLICENSALHRFSKGSTHSTIYFPEVESFHVCTPPLNEQRRIVAKLEDLLARSRRAKHALDAIPPLLEKLRQSILAAAFRGDLTADWRAKNPDFEPAEELLKRIRTERRKKWEEAELAKLRAKGKAPTDDRWKAKYKEPEPVDASDLPELPDGWCWAALRELAWDADYGTSEKCAYEGSGPPVLRIPNVVGGTISLTDLKRAASSSSLTADCFIAPGDLLIVRTNGSKDLVGRGAMIGQGIPNQCSFASYLIRFRLVTRISNWVDLHWGSPSVRDFTASHAASSAGQHNISLTELGSTPIPIAPLEEGDQIIRRVRELLTRIPAASGYVARLRQLCATLDSSLLATAFRGELVEQDPNDEPARVMLERLAAERESAQQAPTKAKRSPRQKTRA